MKINGLINNDSIIGYIKNNYYFSNRFIRKIILIFVIMLIITAIIELIGSDDKTKVIDFFMKMIASFVGIAAIIKLATIELDDNRRKIEKHKFDIENAFMARIRYIHEKYGRKRNQLFNKIDKIKDKLQSKKQKLENNELNIIENSELNITKKIKKGRKKIKEYKRKISESKIKIKKIDKKIKKVDRDFNVIDLNSSNWKHTDEGKLIQISKDKKSY